MATRFTTILSTKGQVILPKEIRERFRWSAGTRLCVEPSAEGVLLKPLSAPFAQTRPGDVFGCFSYAGNPKSVEEMDAAVLAEAKRRRASDRY